MDQFRALLVTANDQGQQANITRLSEADLMPGEVTIAVTHSSLNYKDGLAVTGKAPVIRKFPLIPGIDLGGRVIASTSSQCNVGDEVIVNGWGIGEAHHGGFAERARVKAEWVTALPTGFAVAQAMAIGVAGFTAMMCVMALEEQGVTPAKGEVLVTGAAGGVGTVAIMLLAKLGYNVVAATGRLAETPFLQSLGATQVVDRSLFNTPVKPLAKMRWAGAIDCVGSTTLANVLSQMQEGATVAACGLAQGLDLPTSVAPFILRGVRLIGINSVTVPAAQRDRIWQRLARDIDMTKLAHITTHITLQDVPKYAADIINGQVRGRIVVDM